MTPEERSVPGRRIVIHAGFHKTGSSTIQHFLQTNGPVIWPHSALVLPDRLRPGVARQARRYDDTREPAALEGFREELFRLFDSLSPGRHRRILLSDENMTGRMPGRPGVTGYEVAVPLMVELARAVAAYFPDPDLAFVLTTREPEAWLRSTWRHALRVSRMQQDFAEYSTQMQQVACLDELVTEVQSALGAIEVRKAPLEEADLHLGPGEPVVNMLGLPSSAIGALRPVPVVNSSPPEAVISELLQLNRSSLSDVELDAAKRRLLSSISRASS